VISPGMAVYRGCPATGRLAESIVKREISHL
jgi:hypothetical protein